MSSDSTPSEETRVVYGLENIINVVDSALYKARSQWDSCVEATTPSISTSHLRLPYHEASKRGVKLRYITEVTKDNIDYCKDMMKIVELRHLDRIKGSFAVSDSECVVGIKGRGSSQFTEGIFSNVRQMVTHHKALFEMFWQNAEPAESKIKAIEQGITLSVMEIISSPAETLDRAYSRISSAKIEVLLIFSTPNAVRRHLHAGGLKVIKDAVANHAKVRILVPADKELEARIIELNLTLPQIELKSIDERLKSVISILVVDRKEFFILETRDDTKDEPRDALGQSIYSNSERASTSFALIFESIWNLSELYEKVVEVQMLKDEFINVAAHELRTPVLPIILSAEKLADEYGDKDGTIQLILRNAKRLSRLTNDILDVSRIESNAFHLRRAKGDLKPIVEESIQDANIILAGYEDKKVEIRLEYELPIKISSSLYLDRDRIRQVLTNLLDNAVKFTNDGGIITVKVKQNKESASLIDIEVSDTGKGVDASVKDKLFEKFVTKSKKGGSGLGLYICKAIAQAHGGNIRLEEGREGDKDGSDKKGATFIVTLPIKNE